MNTSPHDDWFETWWASMPEGKLELINGKLIISTFAGSRRVLWELLHDYGPDLVFPMASTALWWAALREAYNPQPLPQTLPEWREWADGFPYEPDVAPAGPQGSAKHQQMSELLRWGLYAYSETSRVGRQLGRDFVIRLGEDGLTPDVLFINHDQCAHFYDRYVDGPPALAIEITLEGSKDQDRIVKKQLYEQAGVPEYWLIEPEALQITFYRLQPEGRYTPLVFDAHDVQRIVETQEDILYDSVAVPGLSLSLLRLWTMTHYDWNEPGHPFLPVAAHAETRSNLKPRDDGIAWDAIPFAPRVDLPPVPIRFEEYVSWCGRAKFERYGGGLKIDGSEGTRRITGMLVMTVGLLETVKLAHPREWVTFLDRDPHQATLQHQTEIMMHRATYESHVYRKDERYYRGSLPQLPDLDGYGETLEACQHDLTQAVRGWMLLRIARREALPHAE